MALIVSCAVKVQLIMLLFLHLKNTGYLLTLLKHIFKLAWSKFVTL